MERLAEQPFNKYERTFNDTATWLAEALEGSMRTRFEYSWDGEDLHASDGQNLWEVFTDAIADAELMARANPEMAFEIRRRHHELAEYKDMVAMARGKLPNTMVVVSDFPAEVTRSIGGYNARRRQTMLRVITWNGHRMGIESQSLDGSNRQALEAIYAQFGAQPEPGELLGQRLFDTLFTPEKSTLAARLTSVYDRSMQEQFGGQYYAGRRGESPDTYQFVLNNREVVDQFTTKFLWQKPTDEDHHNLAAYMDERLHKWGNTGITLDQRGVLFATTQPYHLEEDMRAAGERARAQGKTYDACGMSVGSAQEELAANGYGNKADDDEDKLGSRWFACPKGHLNYRRQANVMEKNCRSCGADVSCKPPKLEKTVHKAGKITLTAVLGIQ